MLHLPWLDALRELSVVSIVVRVALAMLIGGVLGVERGRKNRPAGFRTYMLVSLGATLVMLTNQYVYTVYAVSDPVRMGAQVVSGIGFLGAGTIIVTRRSQVKGITTAAGLWTAACSGLAIGIGYYEGAVIGGAAIFVVIAWMQRVDDFIHRRSRVIELYIELENKAPFSEFWAYANANAFEVSDLQMSKGRFKDEQHFCAILMAKSLTRRNHSEMVEVLSRAPGLHHIEEL